MIKKTIIYWSSGGLGEVFQYAFAHLRKRVYNVSTTVYLYRDLSEAPAEDYSGALKFRVIGNSSELELLNFKRIETLAYRKWFSKGSAVVVGFYDGKPVSFSWGHFHSHQVDQGSGVDLGESAIWIGPTFVDKRVRGKGINKAQIAYQIANLPNTIKVCLTSANKKNVASIRSFESLGFHKGALVTHHQGILSRKTCIRQCFDRGESFIRFTAL